MILLTVSYVVVMPVWWILLLSTERLLLKRGDCYALTNGRKVHMLRRLVMNYFRGLLSTFSPFKKKSFRLYRILQEGRYERKKLAY